MTNRTIARIFSVITLPQVPLAFIGLLLVWGYAFMGPFYFTWIAFGLYLTLEYLVQGWGRRKKTMAPSLFVWIATLLYNAILCLVLSPDFFLAQIMGILAVIEFFLGRSTISPKLATALLDPVIARTIYYTTFIWVLLAVILSGVAIRNVYIARTRL